MGLYMRSVFLNIFIASILFSFIVACNVNTSDNNSKPGIDSTTEPAPQMGTDTVFGDTSDVGAADDHKSTAGNPEASGLPDISGTHDLTLQWIGWNNPGKAILKKTGQDSYAISGSQTGSGQKLEIDGALKMISPLELEFDGTITIRSTSDETAEPCVRKGKQTFLSTKGRKYWRLQNMANCAGGGVVDYVDIYF